MSTFDEFIGRLQAEAKAEGSAAEAELEMFRQHYRQLVDRAESDFIIAVLARLPALPAPITDLSVVLGDLRDRFAHRWSVDDTVAFYRVSECFDPSYPEDAAVKVMAKIAAKYGCR